MNGSQAVVAALRAEGVRYVFGNPGTAEAPLLDALAAEPDIPYILALQEGVAVGMADGYARALRRPAFVNVHLDTGLANAISLLINAAEGGTPMVVTSGNRDVRKLFEGRRDLPQMVQSIVKWSAEVSHVEQIGPAMRRAFHEAASNPPGPVYLAFASNALHDECEADIVASRPTAGHLRPDRDAVDEAAALLAERPAILLAGDRVAQADAVREAVELAELLGCPVYAAHFGEVCFPTSHPQFAGGLGQLLPGKRRVLTSAGAIVAVGTTVFGGFFHVPGAKLSPHTKLIHIDHNAREIGKSEPTDVGIAGDLKLSLAELAEEIALRMTARQKLEAVERRREVVNVLRSRADERQTVPHAAPMCPHCMMPALAAALPSDAIVIEDAGSARGAFHDALQFDAPGSLHGVQGGSIGWGMGSALGVKMAQPARPVVAVVGDGSAAMTMQALWTAASKCLAVVYVVVNNRSYHVLKVNTAVDRQLAGRAQQPFVGLDFDPPLDFVRIAEAMGVEAIRATSPGELTASLERALTVDRPIVIDAIVDSSVSCIVEPPFEPWYAAATNQGLFAVENAR
jgi:benzoylformate decarboxylase